MAAIERACDCATVTCADHTMLHTATLPSCYGGHLQMGAVLVLCPGDCMR